MSEDIFKDFGRIWKRMLPVSPMWLWEHSSNSAALTVLVQLGPDLLVEGGCNKELKDDAVVEQVFHKEFHGDEDEEDAGEGKGLGNSNLD